MKAKFKKDKNAYHHGNLAESLINAVDDIATRFGLEAVTLRACARLLGVSPSSAFRHFPDKRALLTAFATRALKQLSQALSDARAEALQQDRDAFHAVGMAYIAFALDKPAFFRAMWREESIYSRDEDYIAAAAGLSDQLRGGFANTLHDHDPDSLSAQELLAWSSVHGLANLFVDGPVARDSEREHKLTLAAQMLDSLRPLTADLSAEQIAD